MFKTKSYFGVLFVVLLSATIYNVYSVSNVYAATATLSTTGSVNIDVSASGNSANIGTDTLTVNTTCSTGYTVTIQSSIDDTALYKDGDSTSNSKITPTAGTLASPLPIIGDDGNGTSYLGTWGYSMTSSAVTGTFTGLSSTPAIIKQSTTASASGGDQFPVYYGVSVTPQLEVGNYKMKDSGVIVYQLTMPVACETYSIKYDSNGATSSTTMSSQDIPLNAAELNLWPSNYSRTGYGFAGWNTKADGTGTNYGPMETVTIDSNFTNLANQDKEITLYAKWIQAEQNVTMQTWSGCGSMTNGQVIALTDTRDNNTYAIAKLADGKCWMIENLRLGGATAMNLTTSNTAITSDITLPASTNTFTTTATDIQMSAKNTLEAPTNMTTPANAEVYSYGNYYSWPAAIGSTTAYSTNNQSVNTSICPSGWHLPKGGNKSNESNNEFWKLIVTGLNNGTNPANYSSQTRPYYTGDPEGTNVSKLVRKYPNNFIYSGNLNGSSFYYRGSAGYYWSSTVDSSNNSYSLTFASSGVYPGTSGNDKYLGFSVRCVADEEPTASPGKIMYHENGAGSPTGMSEQSASGTTATLWPSNFQHTGGDFGFAGWNTKRDGTGTSYGPMEDITLPSDFATNGLNLYAMWIPSTGNIQNWNGCSSLTTGAVTALKDTRDGNTYAVAKLADSNCWMIENLRLGGTNPINLTTTNTAISSNITLPASTDTFTTSDYTTIEMNATNTISPTTNMTALNTSTPVYSYGNYYSWAAAIGTTTTYYYENVNTSICPKGWKLPYGSNDTEIGGGNTSGSFRYLGTQLGATSNDATSSSIWRSYPNNFLYSGRMLSSYAGNRGTYGYYWSSAGFIQSTNAYYLQLYSSGLNHDVNNKYYGYSVRCVR